MRSEPTKDGVTLEFVDAFAEAWNRHDVDAILAAMTQDAVFEASLGPDVKGTPYSGQAQVRAGIEAVFAQFPDAKWNSPNHFIAGNRGVPQRAALTR